MEVGGIGRPRVRRPNDQDSCTFVSIEAILTRRTAPRRVLRRIEHAARYTGAAHLGIDLLGLCSIVSWYLALGIWCSVLGIWCLILCRLKDKSRGFVRPERAGVEQAWSRRGAGVEQDEQIERRNRAIAGPPSLWEANFARKT